MPLCGFGFECEQKADYHGTRQANYLLDGQLPDAGWIGRSDRQHGASKRGKAGSLHRSNDQTNAGSPKNPASQKAAFSPLANMAAGRFTDADVAACAASNGATRFGVGAPFYCSEQAAPDSSWSASKKKQRGNKYFRNKKKRGKKMTYMPLSVPLQEEEDWDEEIQEVTLKKEEKMDVVIMPYGPEDVIHLPLQGLTLQQSDPADHQAAANYRPAVHHAHPTRWSRWHIPIQSEQFADADE